MFNKKKPFLCHFERLLKINKFDLSYSVLAPLEWWYRSALGSAWPLCQLHKQ